MMKTYNLNDVTVLMGGVEVTPELYVPVATGRDLDRIAGIPVITENMKKFIKANSKSLVVEGEHLTPEFGRINTIEDMERSDRTKYRLEDGETFVIDKEDKASVDYMPQWKLD